MSIQCQIQWVDGKGEPTPDHNVAVCIALSIQTSGPGTTPNIRAFPCCSRHAHELDAMARKHVVVHRFGTTRWVRVDFTEEEMR